MSRNDETEAAFAANQQRRKALQEGVHDITRRLSSPGDLAQAVGETARSGLSEFGSSLRARPLPYALTAMGLIWLVAGAGKTHTKPPTTQSLTRWEDEGGPSLPPDEDAAQIHDRDRASDDLPALALGVGALAVGALMADSLRHDDPLRGKADQSGLAAAIRRETSAALTESEKTFRGLLGAVGTSVIDEVQGALDRFLGEVKHAVDPQAESRADADRNTANHR